MIHNAIRQNPITAFFAITLAIGSTASLGIWLLPDRAAAFVVFGIPIAFSSAIAAYAVLRAEGDRDRQREWLGRILRLRVPLMHYVIAAAIPIGLWLLAALPFVAAGQIGPVAWGSVITLPIQLVMIFAEEVGWRAFALPRLQGRMNPASASLLIGIGWGAYHMAAYLQTPVTALITFVLSVAGAFVLTWLFNRSQESVPVVTLFHTMLNVTGPFILLPAAAPDAVTPMLVLFTALLAITAAILFIKGPLRQPRSGSQRSSALIPVKPEM